VKKSGQRNKTPEDLPKKEAVLNNYQTEKENATAQEE